MDVDVVREGAGVAGESWRRFLVGANDGAVAIVVLGHAPKTEIDHETEVQEKGFSVLGAQVMGSGIPRCGFVVLSDSWADSLLVYANRYWIAWEWGLKFRA